jgi:hypothetical protein
MNCLESSWVNGGRQFNITAWKDFGPCDTPFDPQWRYQTIPIHGLTLKSQTKVNFLPGSIRHAFDTHSKQCEIDGSSIERSSEHISLCRLVVVSFHN